jgi:beta-N-acetylhexosaminidase
MVGADGDDPKSVAALLDSATRPGGVFVRGGTAIWEQRTLVNPLGDDLPLLVAVDDEGGRVQPMGDVVGELASAAELAGESVESLESAAADRGADLRGLGITVVLAPVVDVGSAGGIGDRSFGDTSEVVTAKAGAYAAGLREGGVLPVLKHFPGQGHADADTHEAPASVPELTLLRTSDLVPYGALLADAPVGVMVGHLDVPGLTEAGVPASLSAAAVGLLRSGYEFGGLVITDDLSAMRAVLDRFTVPEAAERALAAGADVLLLAHDTDVEAVLDRLEEAVNLGRIPDRRLDAAIARVVAAGCPAA